MRERKAQWQALLVRGRSLLEIRNRSLVFGQPVVRHATQRDELKVARLENEILKRAAAYFAKENVLPK